MKPEALRNSALLSTVSDLVSDLADLFQKEMKLARAELSETVSSTLQAGFWMVAGAVLGLVALFLIVQAAVYGLMAAGMPGYAACLVLAAVLAGLAVAAIYKGRADATLSAKRSIRQMKETAKVAKEQLQ